MARWWPSKRTSWVWRRGSRRFFFPDRSAARLHSALCSFAPELERWCAVGRSDDPRATAGPSPAQVSRLAYDRWLARGAAPDDAVADWLSAERDLIALGAAGTRHWATAARRLYRSARSSAERHRLDAGWECFHAARRMLIFGYDRDTLLAQ